MLVGLVSWVCRGERRGAALMADWGGGILVEGSSRMEGILGIFFFFFFSLLLVVSVLVLVLVLGVLPVVFCSSIVDGQNPGKEDLCI